MLLALQSSSGCVRASATRGGGGVCAVKRLSSSLTIGIRREDPGRLWERRCPITPDAIRELVQDAGVKVLVQDCDRRIWTREEFIKVCLVLSLLCIQKKMRRMLKDMVRM